MTTALTPTTTRPRNLERAALLVDRACLDLRPRVDRDQAVALVARVPHYCDPLVGVHGRLQVAALHPPPAATHDDGRPSSRPPTGLPRPATHPSPSVAAAAGPAR